MALRAVHSVAIIGGAAVLGLLTASLGKLETLIPSSGPRYMSSDNPWAVGSSSDDAPRWQRQAFIDYSQDGDPGSASQAFARVPRRTTPTYSVPAFRNCAAARAAGVATPIYRGQPGYGAHMDGDGDGIACEPPR